MSTKKLFFELIQVAIGRRICLSHTPSADEWGELYAMAKKQSLVGVCFAGVQRLQQQCQEPPEMLYLTWMGMAAKIQQRNEVVNRQCIDLQEKFTAGGFRSCILKGQGVAQLYDENLRPLRQSGDIDVWIPEDKAAIVTYVKQVCEIETLHETSMHVDMPIFDDTEVEVHFIPTMSCNPVANRRMQRWIKAETNAQTGNIVTLSDGLSINVPTNEFNIIFLVSHAFKHLMSEGVGFRQIMDIYYAIRSVNLSSAQKERIIEKLGLFGLLRFTQGLMWVLKETLLLDEKDMLVVADEVHGKYIYEELLKSGNFGHDDDRLESKNYKGRSRLQLKRNIKQFRYYPAAAIGSFYWRLKKLTNLKSKN